MAAYLNGYPYAFRGFPLHAVTSISQSGALFTKKELRQAGIRIRRRTAGDVDLGFGSFVRSAGRSLPPDPGMPQCRFRMFRQGISLQRAGK